MDLCRIGGAVGDWRVCEGRFRFDNRRTSAVGRAPRIFARSLQERIGGAVIVENRPGANGNVAAAALMVAPADGYTFVVSDCAILTINPLIYAKLSYKPDDLLPIAVLARAPLFLAVNARVPAGTLGEFIA